MIFFSLKSKIASMSNEFCSITFLVISKERKNLHKNFFVHQQEKFAVFFPPPNMSTVIIFLFQREMSEIFILILFRSMKFTQKVLKKFCKHSNSQNCLSSYCEVIQMLFRVLLCHARGPHALTKCSYLPLSLFAVSSEKEL